ncbi:hypothetical protein LAB1_38870 [Roseibium sp. LAB1]
MAALFSTFPGMTGLAPHRPTTQTLGGLMPKPAPATLVTSIARGYSGQTYEFQIDPIGTAYHFRSGVYMFIKRAMNGKWDIIYIGETENFDRRLKTELESHHRWECIRTAGATHISTMHVPGALIIRETIETDLRNFYDPPCNLQ